MDICLLINEYAKKELIAHRYRESKMTYNELNEKSNALATYIIEFCKEEKEGAPIIVYGHKEHLMLVCFIACIKSGHAYIPIDTSMPEERVFDIAQISKAKMVFNIGNKKLTLNNTTIWNSQELEEKIEANKSKVPDEKYKILGESVHYIIYTSGSTGKPKGVQITSNCLSSFVEWGIKFIGSPGGKPVTFMNQAPFSFDLSVMDLYLSLYTGGTLYSIDKEMISSLKQLFSYFKKSDINVWVSTPSFAEMCLADSSFNGELLPKLSHILFCGETLANNCVKRLFDRFENLEIVNFYGPTEATVAVTAVTVDPEMCEAINPLPVGYVKKDCKLFIVKEANSEVPVGVEYLDYNGIKYVILKDGEKGEIVICGSSVSPGYFNNEEITKTVFLKKWVNGIEERYYRTGDEGYIQEGMLYYSGRIDFQVKLNGFRVELGDIESNLMDIDFIESAVVLPIMKNDKLYQIAAVVILNKSFEEKDFAISQMIKERLKKLLPEYMIPRKIIIRESIPMTPNGKVNRKLLLEELT
jgi:D-alanine--poly(phosphoribitol) ligase subunit 1